MLLDTHVVLWLLQDDARLGISARQAIADADEVHVSSASLWEIAIKRGLGRIVVPDDLVDLVERAGLRWLKVAPRHAWAVQDVSLPHNDPFDRLLLAQAAREQLRFLTADRVLLEVATDVVTLDARI